MRSLLDILNDEKSLANRLEKIDSMISKIEKDVEFVKSIEINCEAKTRDLSRYSENLYFLQTEKEEAEKELFEVRAELKEYLRILLANV